MFRLSRIAAVISIVSNITSLSSAAASLIPTGSHQYSRAHSLGSGYMFDSRDGWQHVNVTNLSYKYAARESASILDSSPSDNPELPAGRLVKHVRKSSGSSPVSALGATVSHLVNDVWNSLKGVGQSEPVTITWYTGHDLLNPSCWSQTNWAPSDQSFACALTLEGWTTRPKCFEFLEVCNTPKKCVFVRVVDSCAGCAAGSKHVDLTKAAFSQLADINEGVLTVQMRPATNPKEWYEDLWGPKAN